MRKKDKLIEIKSEVKIGSIILEKGDRVKILNEQLKSIDIETFKSIIEQYTVGATELVREKGTGIKFDKPYKIDWYETKNTMWFYFGTKSFEFDISWNDMLSIEIYEENKSIVITTKGMYIHFALKAKDLSFI